MTRTSRDDSGGADRLVWHYTSSAALISIIESGQLWASDCNFLNDRNEADLADELFKTAMGTRSLPWGEWSWDLHRSDGLQADHPDHHRWFVLCSDSLDDHLGG